MPFKIEEDCNKVLLHDEKILDAVLQAHEVMKNGSVALGSTLGIRKKISAFQEPDELMVYNQTASRL
jgi:hypothetical protein